MLSLPIVAGILPITLFFCGYHGQRSFSELGALPQATAVVANARTLKGTPYDPFMGAYNNLGAKWGFIVCSDVINLAYGKSGFSWQKQLQQDFVAHATFYDSRDGNNPTNPYFHRRARNLFSYFKANHRLESPAYKPSPGDVVFYRKSVNAPIAHVTLVTAWDGDRYRVMESAPRTLFAQEVDQASPLNRGWVVAGVGRMY